MSEMEFWVGKVVKVQPKENETVEQMCERMLGDEKSYGDTFLEKLTDKHYKTYLSYNGELYDYSGTKDIEDDGYLTQASLNSDGSIEIALRFYNGGCPLREAFEEAMDRLHNGKLQPKDKQNV